MQDGSLHGGDRVLPRDSAGPEEEEGNEQGGARQHEERRSQLQVSDSVQTILVLPVLVDYLRRTC